MSYLHSILQYPKIHFRCGITNHETSPVFYHPSKYSGHRGLLGPENTGSCDSETIGTGKGGPVLLGLAIFATFWVFIVGGAQSRAVEIRPGACSRLVEES